MRNARTIRNAMLAGGIAGTLILGVVGRLVMAGVALVAGRDLNLSFRGLIEVIIIGAVWGGLGGLVLVVIRSLVAPTRRAHTLTLAAVLFGASFLAFCVRGRILLDPVLLLTLAAAVALFILYSLTTDALLTCFERHAKDSERSAPT